MDTMMFGEPLSSWIIYWVRSFLEVLLIFAFNNAIAGQSRLPVKKLFALGFGVSIIVLSYDFVMLPFTPFVTLFLCILGLRLVSHDKFSELLSNLIFGVTVTFILELFVHGICFLMDEKMNTNTGSAIMAAVLAVTLIAISVISVYPDLLKGIKLKMEAYRHIILLVSISTAVPAVILSDLFLNDSMLLWGSYYGTIISVALYGVLNLYLIKYFRDSIRKENEVQIMREYGDYMKETADILNRREHEHKNQLNVIIGIAEMEGPEYRRQIIDYAEELIHQYERRKPVGSAINDNSVIAAYLFKFSRLAESREITFDHYAAKPFPDYQIPESIMLELLANLLNNAFEAVENLLPEKKRVSLSLYDKVIEVTNYVSGEFSMGLIQSRQIQGSSTKGKNRGYGLANITDICRRYDIKMEAYLKEDMLCMELRFR